jgi:shikimate dehydrogenase
MSAIGGQTAVYAVLGWPVAHSLSPALHNRWFIEAGIDAVYVALPTRPTRGRALLDALQTLGIAGANLTAPHKTDRLDTVDHATPAARATGAVNTLVPRDGGWVGDNTDAQGFVDAHAALFGDRWAQTDVVVLGAGGAAAAVAAGVVTAGARSVCVAARRAEAAEALVGRLRAHRVALGSPEADVRVAAWEADAVRGAALVVVATGHGGEAVGVAWADHLAPGTVVADLNYWHDGPSLRSAAAALGHPVTDGSGMLLHQAAAAFALWTGCAPALSLGREILDAHLAARFGYRPREG